MRPFTPTLPSSRIPPPAGGGWGGGVAAALLVALLGLAGCDDKKQAEQQAPPAAAKDVAATAKAVAVGSRGEQLFRDAERAANLGRDLEARQTYERALEAFKSAADRPGEARTLLAMGSLDRAMGQGERGRAVLRDAEAAYVALGDAKGRADAVFALGELERAQFNNEAARTVFDRAVGLYHAAGEWAGEARALLGRGDAERRLARILAAQRSAMRATAIFTVLNDTAGLTLAKRSLDEVTGNYPDDNEAARQEIRNKILDGQQGADIQAEGVATLELAMLEHNAGRPEHARDAYQKAIARFAEARDVPNQLFATIGLGDLERDIERVDAAQEAYEAAQALVRILGDADAEARVLVGLAAIELVRGSDANTRRLAQRSQELAKRAGNDVVQGMALIVLGQLEKKGGRLESADQNFSDAIALLEPVDPVGAGMGLVTFGDMLREESFKDDAIDMYARARELFEKAGNRLGEAWALRGLGRATGTAIARIPGEPPEPLTPAEIMDAKVDLLVAGQLFGTLGMERRRVEVTTAVNAIGVPPQAGSPEAMDR